LDKTASAITYSQELIELETEINQDIKEVYGEINHDKIINALDNKDYQFLDNPAKGWLAFAVSYYRMAIGSPTIEDELKLIGNAKEHLGFSRGTRFRTKLAIKDWQSDLAPN
jgi:hypothetical protein